MLPPRHRPPPTDDYYSEVRPARSMAATQHFGATKDHDVYLSIQERCGGKLLLTESSLHLCVSLSVFISCVVSVRPSMSICFSKALFGKVRFDSRCLPQYQPGIQRGNHTVAIVVIRGRRSRPLPFARLVCRLYRRRTQRNFVSSSQRRGREERKLN